MNEETSCGTEAAHPQTITVLAYPIVLIGKRIIPTHKLANELPLFRVGVLLFSLLPVAAILLLCDAFWEATSSEPELAAELVPITYRLTESMRLISKMPEGRARDMFQARLVLMYLLMDRLFYLVNIQGRSATAMKMLEEFSEILWESLFSEGMSPPSR